ncbi:GtrA family protein [Massilia sp. R2A-15]|uniref:GtrA family protein n=1 Tax=Massilia sp. R2A-15 TaxID=3064278 RepID=UPI002736E7CA|nr:GtrA family protein [Massilia sp. R2A-15]WLI88885.1 GtrA family protein [Massilia sp. R2A-15]
MTAAAARLSPLLRHAVVKFAGVGVLNTLLTLAIIFCLTAWFGVGDARANLAGYLAGLAFSFTLNRRWTFQSSAAALPALARFLLVFGVSYLLNIAIVLGLIRLGLNNYLAHMAGMPFYSIAFYLGCRHVAFPATAPAARAAAVPHSGRWYAAALLALGAVLLYRLGAAPVAIWDESRLANNAIEMAQHGLSLVTTYDGVPDHWNTKPPLLIWLMALSIRLLGANEWALRLPSVLAAFGTASMLYWFCAWRLRRPFAGFAAVLVLLATPGYVIAHGARAGDYDALLTLWTTGYLLAGYLFVHAARARENLWLGLCAACIVLAFLTKTIQGLIFLPVLAAYALLHGRVPALLRMRAFYSSVALIAAVCIGYYVLREQADPGYFAAARANDLGGRYGTVIEHHDGPFYWYLGKLPLFPWMLPAIACGWALARRGAGEERATGRFIGLAALFYLVVISSASTKLAWYAAPLAPLMALLVGMAFARTRATPRALAAGGAIALACVVALNIGLVERAVAKTDGAIDGYSLMLRDGAVAPADLRRLVIVHPGYPNGHGDPFYVAPTLFYVTALRAAGNDVVIQPASARIGAGAGTLLACGAPLLEKVKGEVALEAVARRGECGLYRITARRRANS